MEPIEQTTDQEVVETEVLETPESVEEPYLPGMSWKNKDEAAKGVAEMKSLMDRQGNELGMTRKQLETMNSMMEKMMASQQPQQPEKPQGPDYDAEINAIYQQMETLDPMADDYNKQVVNMTKKANQLTAKAQHERTLDAATKRFKEELSERENQQKYKKFYDDNPDFQSPEMQQRIRDQLSQDDTGLRDPLVAYREIQLADERADKQRISAENAEMKRLVDLRKNENRTDKVIGKPQSTPSQTTAHAKVTGSELDKGMMAALQRSKAG